MPVACPSCGSPVVREAGEVAYRCPNRSCPAQIVESIIHFVRGRHGHRRDGRGGRGLAARSRPADQMSPMSTSSVSAGLSSVPLFSKDAKAPLGDALMDIVVPGKNAEKLLAAIATSKEQPFARVLYALGIPHVGFVTAQALVEHFPQHGRP